MNTGVYLITNLVNNKVYVGSTGRSFDVRWSQHKLALNHGTHHSPHLQRSWDKYGESNFVFEVVVRCPKRACIEKEQLYLDLLDPTNRSKGYNLLPVADSPKGVKMSEATRLKMSLAQKGIPKTPEAIAKRSLKQKGMKRSQASRERMRDAHLIRSI